MRVSRNLALDVVRREKVFRNKEGEIIGLMEQRNAAGENGDSVFGEQEIKDDGLRMMFVCCHPLVPHEAQVALALKTLCGFSIGEISKAFLTTEAAIAKRLTRAGQKIREARIPSKFPVGESAQRLDGVLQTLYLLFNEGYKASSARSCSRRALSGGDSAGSFVGGTSGGQRAQHHALLALMLLNGARLPTRMDVEATYFSSKNRTACAGNRAMIGRGMFHLALSAVARKSPSIISRPESPLATARHGLRKHGLVANPFDVRSLG